MKQNTQFTVSVQILILVAHSNGYKITSNTISESTGCNPVMVRQQFVKLKKAGLLNVSAGKGLTSLAKKPEKINLWEIFAAIAGSDRNDFFAFHPNISKTCKVGCSFEKVLGGHLDDTMIAIKNSLENVTLAQVIDEIFITENNNK